VGALDPFEQRAAEVHADTNCRMLGERFEEREITSRVGMLYYIVEVSDGLVRMKDERQLKLAQRNLRTNAGVTSQSIANADGHQSAETNRFHQKLRYIPLTRGAACGTLIRDN
jgi:hypothetical protein